MPRHTPTPPRTTSEHTSRRSEPESELEPEQQRTERPSRALKATRHHNSDSRLTRRPREQNSQVAQRPVDNAEDVTRTEPQTQIQSNNGRGGAPAVRLDMNLDVDIKMKAKIKGYIELSIL